MKPVAFPEENAIFAKNQPQYLPLPAFRDVGLDGRVVCCWSLTWKERLQVLLRGRIWLQMLTFHKSLQPHKLTVDKPDMESK